MSGIRRPEAGIAAKRLTRSSASHEVLFPFSARLRRALSGAGQHPDPYPLRRCVAAALPSPRESARSSVRVIALKTESSRLGAWRLVLPLRRAWLCLFNQRRHCWRPARRVQSLDHAHSLKWNADDPRANSPILHHSVRRPARVMHRGSPEARCSATREASDIATLPVDRTRDSDTGGRSWDSNRSALFAGLLPSAGGAGVSAYPHPACRLPKCILLNGRFHRSGRHGRVMIERRPKPAEDGLVRLPGWLLPDDPATRARIRNRAAGHRSCLELLLSQGCGRVRVCLLANHVSPRRCHGNRQSPIRLTADLSAHGFAAPVLRGCVGLIRHSSTCTELFGASHF